MLLRSCFCVVVVVVHDMGCVVLRLVEDPVLLGQSLDRPSG